MISTTNYFLRSMLKCLENGSVSGMRGAKIDLNNIVWYVKVDIILLHKIDCFWERKAIMAATHGGFQNHFGKPMGSPWVWGWV